jgi:hypothetical protein
VDFCAIDERSILVPRSVMSPTNASGASVSAPSDLEIAGDVINLNLMIYLHSDVCRNAR